MATSRWLSHHYYVLAVIRYCRHLSNNLNVCFHLIFVTCNTLHIPTICITWFHSIVSNNIHDKQNEISTYGFETPRKSACRHLWRCCVEHHAFFRLVRVLPIQSQDNEIFSLGSRFRFRYVNHNQFTKIHLVKIALDYLAFNICRRIILGEKKNNIWAQSLRQKNARKHACYWEKKNM